MTKTLEEVKKSFKDKSLFEHAMTHRSWINENPNIRRSNERLEFLGDAVLELVVSDHIYHEFPNEEEGFLTTLRANIVNTQNLARVANKINLGSEILLSKGEEMGNGRENESLLADTTEALIGAMYLDSGLESAQEFIMQNLLAQLSDKLALPLKDAKSRLQEQVQSTGLPTPKYKTVSESGPDHDKEFVVEVLVDNKAYAQGVGKSKNRAEQAAAEAALVKWEENE
ncbi:ribonuclease III [Candidatus Microgenomates bacterium]|nr:MAG: ribonuclease III [Candidatus Microgenomates bacterium]